MKSKSGKNGVNSAFPAFLFFPIFVLKLFLYSLLSKTSFGRKVEGKILFAVSLFVSTTFVIILFLFFKFILKRRKKTSQNPPPLAGS